MISVMAVVGSAEMPARQSQHDSETAKKVAGLGSEDYSIPSDLADLVKTAQASIVATLVAVGDDLKWSNSFNKSGILMAVDAFATYRFLITDVLYNRLKKQAPPLASGVETDVRQMVGRSSAEAFLAKKAPVKPGDECVLFLWHRPGAAEWSVLQWPLQFRKSLTLNEVTAEAASPLETGRGFVTTQWLGPAVPALSKGQVIVPRWQALIKEVRRLGAP
jgi:hypothetical protein